VDYKDLEKLSKEEVEKIKRRGSVVIKDVVDDQKAIGWRESLREFVKVNPTVEGTSFGLNGSSHFLILDFISFISSGNPADNKQFFQL
jgi:hypothetical protein